MFKAEEKQIVDIKKWLFLIYVYNRYVNFFLVFSLNTILFLENSLSHYLDLSGQISFQRKVLMKKSGQGKHYLVEINKLV